LPPSSVSLISTTAECAGQIEDERSNDRSALKQLVIWNLFDIASVHLTIQRFVSDVRGAKVRGTWIMSTVSYFLCGSVQQPYFKVTRTLEPKINQL
jgi:hypothetical protein